MGISGVVSYLDLTGFLVGTVCPSDYSRRPFGQVRLRRLRDEYRHPGPLGASDISPG